MEKIVHSVFFSLLFYRFSDKFGSNHLIHLLNEYLDKYQNPVFLTWKSAPNAVKILERAKTIYKECISIVRGGFDIPNLVDVDPNQKVLQTSHKWKVAMFQIHGKYIKTNIGLAPRTFETIVNAKTWNAFISIYEPGCVVPFHIGPCKSFLTYMLALEVPDDKDNCYLIASQDKNYRYTFKKREGVLFDDSYPNTLINATTQRLTILYINFKREMSELDSIISDVCFKLVSDSKEVLEACHRSVLIRL